ncbi:hypothetical protein RYX36_010250, partial [Vicia faba]
METRASKKRTTTIQPPFFLIPKRQRVVLEQFPDLNFPDCQPVQKLKCRKNPNLNKSSLTSTIYLLPNSNLDKPVCNKSNAKREHQHIFEPYVSDISHYLHSMEMQ